VNKDAGASKTGPQRHNVRWSAVGLFVFLMCFSGLGFMTIRGWQDLNQTDRFLDVSLVSKSTADYSANSPKALVAQVGMGIVGDMIRDSHPDPANLPARLAVVNSILNGPVPIETPVPGSVNPHISITEEPRPAQPPAQPHVTSAPDNPPTAIVTTPDPEPNSTPVPTAKPTKDPGPQNTKNPNPGNPNPGNPNPGNPNPGNPNPGNPKPGNPNPGNPNKPPKPPKPDKPKKPKKDKKG
jgi:hypothetical protein